MGHYTGGRIETIFGGLGITFGGLFAPGLWIRRVVEWSRLDVIRG